MKFSRLLLSAGLALATFVGANANVARADVLVQSQTLSVPPTAAPFSTTLDFNKYTGSDPLSRVEIIVTQTIGGVSTVINTTPDTHNFSSIATTVPVEVTGPNGAINVAATATHGAGSVSAGVFYNPPGIYYSATNFAMMPGMANDSANYTTGLSAYTTTPVVSVSIGVAANNAAVLGIGDLGLAYQGNAVVGVTVTLKYYSPVPEPTSSAMFGIGIVLAVGLGWGRRRRELNKLAA